MVYQFNDILTNKECFSDEYKFAKEDAYGPGIISIEAKYITVDEDSDEPRKELDIVEYQAYNKATLKKKPCMMHLKGYMGAIKEKLIEQGKESEAEEFLKTYKKFIKELVFKKFDDFDFYYTDACDDHDFGPLAMGYWKEGASTPTFYFFEHAFLKKKC